MADDPLSRGELSAAARRAEAAIKNAEAEVVAFVDLCRRRFRASNATSAALVLLGYLCLIGATFAGILSPTGGKVAASGTFMAVVAIGVEQSFGLSAAADLQATILAEAENLLSELRGKGAKPPNVLDALGKLRLRLASASRRSRTAHLRGLTNQHRVPFEPSDDRREPGENP